MAGHFRIGVVTCKFTILAVHIHDRSTKVRILNQCDLSVYESRTAFNVTWRETKFEVVFVVFYNKCILGPMVGYHQNSLQGLVDCSKTQTKVL